MDAKTWLMLDCNFLCHRAFHAFRGLSFGAEGTGVLYGFFREVQTLMELQATRHVAFFFDAHPLNRKTIFPGYKARRHSAERLAEMTEEEREARKDMYRQVDLLRTRYLKEVGFRNVFAAPGFEADDLIAAAGPVGPRDEVVIVSADKDLYQLVGKRTTLWNPTSKKAVNLKSFRKEWGIDPPEWAKVKAVAGCPTDEVPGLDGVAEKTMTKFLRGELAGKKADAIRAFQNTDQYAVNLRLVGLPLDGCPRPELVDDRVDGRAWTKLTNSLGMRSIADRPPGVRGNGFPLGV